MCGIVGAVAQRNVTPILLEGLKRLEYRGYDSAGVAIINGEQRINRLRTQGKVNRLETALIHNPLTGHSGIAHTRWATHGEPAEHNAHPHVSQDDIAVVHNGIIENHDQLRLKLIEEGYTFSSDTDSEVIVHMVHKYRKSEGDLLAAVRATVKQLDGAFALGIVCTQDPNRLIAVRTGSPLVIGVGIGEHFISSDTLALLPVTQKFIYLEDGDMADIRLGACTMYNFDGKEQKRRIHRTQQLADQADKGKYRHFMLKEIFEQPFALNETIQGRLNKDHVIEQAFGSQICKLLAQTQRVQIVACGTSFHAAEVARYWIEALVGIPCHVEIASEFRYRAFQVEPQCLFVSISQSGETADTLAALRKAKQLNYLGSIAICNVPESSLVRESNYVIMTRAGTEIGVASTKAFTTQLVALLMLTLLIGRHHQLDSELEKELVTHLRNLPHLIEKTLELDTQIQTLATQFTDKIHTLFLGRGIQFPIAQEGALKLKEISYIHAEAYPAGELKHGPLALVDKKMPVVSLIANDDLIEKVKSNLHEVQSRGGQLIVFADEAVSLQSHPNVHVIQLPKTPAVIAPIVFTVPLQLLAYHVAVIKGTDVDQPRNLAKSVTVE